MPAPTPTSQTNRLRRENLLRLLREFTEAQLSNGVPAKGIELAFAAHLEVSPSTLSQLKNSRNMGDKMAAQIEQHAGKAPGWIDVEHPGVMGTPGESAFVELSRLAWRATDAKGRRSLMRLAKSKFAGVLEALASLASCVSLGLDTLPSLFTACSSSRMRRLSAAISERNWAEAFFKPKVSERTSLRAIRAISVLRTVAIFGKAFPFVLKRRLSCPARK